MKALTTDIEQTGIEYVELGHFEEYICIADSRCVDRNILFRVYTDAPIYVCTYIHGFDISKSARLVGNRNDGSLVNFDVEKRGENIFQILEV